MHVCCQLAHEAIGQASSTRLYTTQVVRRIKRLLTQLVIAFPAGGHLLELFTAGEFRPKVAPLLDTLIPGTYSSEWTTGHPLGKGTQVGHYRRQAQTQGNT